MGGYACMCTVGFKASSGKETFKVDQKVICEDIDECTEEDCGPNATCQNNEGSYACICNAGFKISSGKETCEKDMCTVKNCGPYATCQNIEGGYTCVCKDGFVTSNGNDTFLADQGVTCQDKDECVLNATICGGNAKCHNIPGNYFCSCNPGFSQNNKTGICEAIARGSIANANKRGDRGHPCLVPRWSSKG
ncbi:adhesion G protein-coupled receptor E1 [Sardina pilchardus]|uniref:adhesion G protein-coupled receptor E1 n=1 Tax=Sardina pilchardus TaxID=27697 RepID=UPI002E0EF7F9